MRTKTLVTAAGILLFVSAVWATKPPKYHASVIAPGFTFGGFAAYKKASVTFDGSVTGDGFLQGGAINGYDEETWSGDVIYAVGIYDNVEISLTTRFQEYGNYYPFAWFTFLVAKDLGVKFTVLNRGERANAFKNIVVSPFLGGGFFGGHGGVSVGTQFATPKRQVLGELTCYPNFSLNRYEFTYYYPENVGYDEVSVTLMQTEVEIPVGVKFTFGEVIKASVYGSVALNIPVNVWDISSSSDAAWDFYVSPVAASAGFAVHFGSKRSREVARSKRDGQSVGTE